MGESFGHLWVGCDDRDRVVGLIRRYWMERAARPLWSGDRAPAGGRRHRSYDIGELVLYVGPPARGRVDSAGGPLWIPIVDNGPLGDSGLGLFLADALGAVVIHLGVVDSADGWFFMAHGDGGPSAPKDRDGVLTFMWDHLPQPQSGPDWAELGFTIPYRPGSDYGAPPAHQVAHELARRDAAARAAALVAAGDVAGFRALWNEAGTDHGRWILRSLEGRCESAEGRRLVLALAEEILGFGHVPLVTYYLAEAALMAGAHEVHKRAQIQLEDSGDPPF